MKNEELIVSYLQPSVEALTATRDLYSDGFVHDPLRGRTWARFLLVKNRRYLAVWAPFRDRSNWSIAEQFSLLARVTATAWQADSLVFYLYCHLLASCPECGAPLKLPQASCVSCSRIWRTGPDDLGPEVPAGSVKTFLIGEAQHRLGASTRTMREAWQEGNRRGLGQWVSDTAPMWVGQGSLDLGPAWGRLWTVGPDERPHVAIPKKMRQSYWCGLVGCYQVLYGRVPATVPDWYRQEIDRVNQEDLDFNRLCMVFQNQVVYAPCSGVDQLVMHHVALQRRN